MNLAALAQLAVSRNLTELYQRNALLILHRYANWRAAFFPQDIFTTALACVGTLRVNSVSRSFFTATFRLGTVTPTIETYRCSLTYLTLIKGEHHINKISLFFNESIRECC